MPKTEEKQAAKAVIYARYSSDRQREESIEGQLRVCEDYARRNNITILHTYADRAMTGRSDQRPEFQMMIRDAATIQNPEPDPGGGLHAHPHLGLLLLAIPGIHPDGSGCNP